MAPRINVSPAASATSQTQPHQAGTRKVPQDLSVMLSNIVNTLREASAFAINPRISPATASLLSGQSLALQHETNAISTRLDTLDPDSDRRLSVYNDLNVLGGQVQSYVQAVANAIEGVGEGLQTNGGVRLGALTPEEEAAKSKKIWIAVGVGSVLALAGLTAYLVSRQQKKSSRGYGKITGAMSAR